jgi:hypothetical protein|tara:strand:+ start:227 stop:400 length:174 start_codon:yes stop_codon:yes gene_type:complete
MLQHCSAADERAERPVSGTQVPGTQVSGISQHGARISRVLGESVFGLTLVSRLRSMS